MTAIAFIACALQAQNLGIIHAYKFLDAKKRNSKMLFKTPGPRMFKRWIALSTRSKSILYLLDNASGFPNNYLLGSDLSGRWIALSNVLRGCLSKNRPLNFA